MTIKRDMLNLYALVRKQGCNITRWKITEGQAKALAPSIGFYQSMLLGKAKFFGISIKVIHDRQDI